MKLLLTHGYFIAEDQVEQQIMKPYPPLGILYLSAYLNERGVEHQLLDTTFSTTESLLNHIEESTPDVIAIYTNLMTKVKILQLIKLIKEKGDTKILLGGPDITYNWENYLDHGADFLVIGEGEETLYEFTQQYIGAKDFSSIPGLAFKDGTGKKIKNEARIKIKNIDELPFPNRTGIDLEKYLNIWQQYHGKRTLNVSTQRGCPYTCKWCSTAVYGQSYRRRSPKLVVDEIEWLIKEYQPDALWFVDDVFTVSHKWIKAFHQEMKSRSVSIQYECITRAERLNTEVLELLKDSGCFRIWIGAESGSQPIVDAMDRKVNVHTVREMMQETRALGMEAGTFIMVGYPGEKEEDILETVEHLKACNPSAFTITKAYPIKGTALYHQVEKDIVYAPEWAASTDRQIDFKRTYSNKYYEYAIKYMVNELKAYQAVTNPENKEPALKYRVKAKLARMLMRTSK